MPYLYGMPAATFSVERDGDTLTASLVEGAAPGWSVLLEGVHEAASGDAEHTERGVRLRPDGDQVVARLS